MLIRNVLCLLLARWKPCRAC